MNFKNQQVKNEMEWAHQLMYNMIFTKEIKDFEYVDPCGKSFTPIDFVTISSYHHTLKDTTSQYIFRRDMIFNIASIIDWCIITSIKQQQVKIDNSLQKLHTIQT